GGKRPVTVRQVQRPRQPLPVMGCDPHVLRKHAATVTGARLPKGAWLRWQALGASHRFAEPGTMPSTVDSMGERREFDVAVVGLGGLGSAAAYWLARAGHDVIGFEQFE